jgi:hypothetical protein
MNPSPAHIINSLIEDDMDKFCKMKKTELLKVVRELQVSNYYEMTDSTLQDIYDDRYNAIIEKLWSE